MPSTVTLRQCIFLLCVTFCSGARRHWDSHDAMLDSNKSHASEVSSPRHCTVFCEVGKACGDVCIPNFFPCESPPGIACNGKQEHQDTMGSRVQAIFGSNLVAKAIRQLLQPWLEGLFANLQIPDIPIMNGKLFLRGLYIEYLKMSEIELPRETPPPIEGAQTVTTLAVKCRASIKANTYLGEGGDTKISIEFVDTELRVDVELFKHINSGEIWLVITKIFIVDVNDGRTQQSLVASEPATWKWQLLNLGVSMLQSRIIPLIVNGINGWGGGPCNTVLRWPLAVLNQIALGPGGRCMGADYEHYQCRAMSKIEILQLATAADYQALHAVISFAPYVRRTRLSSSRTAKQLAEAHISTTHNQIAPIYHGTPMRYESPKDTVMDNYMQAFQECVKQWPECNSVYGFQLGREDPRGVEDIGWALGRTMLPIADSETLGNWEFCANEGEVCHVSDPPPPRWDWEESKGQTTPERFMRIQFDTGMEKAEKTAFDAGNGIPCAWYYFYNGRHTKKNSTGGKCFRLKSPTRLGSLDAPIATGNSGLACPFHLPCAAGRECWGMKKREDQGWACPTGSVNDWLGKFPLTQPVVLSEVKNRFCTGPDMLPCSVTEPWDNREQPPSLNTQLPSINANTLQLRLSTDVLTSALASLYTAGVLDRFPFSVPAANTVSKLCNATKNLICADGDPDAPVKLGIIEEMPGRVETGSGGLQMKLSLQLSVYVQTPETENIPDDELLPPARRCLSLEGAVKMQRKSVNTKAFSYGAEEYKWIELEGFKLRIYDINGRNKEASINIKDWKIDLDKHSDLSIKLSASTKGTAGAYRLIFQYPARMQEWLHVLTDPAMKSCLPIQDKGWSARAWMRFSVDAKLGVDVVDDTFICLRPDVKALKLPTVGELHYRRSEGFTHIAKASAATTLIAASSGGTLEWLIRKILINYKVVKPMQVYNLNHLGFGVGLVERTDLYGPMVTLRDNYISLIGDATEPQEGTEGGAAFDNGPENRCIIRDIQSAPSVQKSATTSFFKSASTFFKSSKKKEAAVQQHHVDAFWTPK